MLNKKKRNNQTLVVLGLCLLMGIGGCTNKENHQTTTQVCQSAKHPGNGYVLKVDQDKDTLKTIKVTFHIDEELLKEEQKNVTGTISLDEIYQYYRDQLYNEYLYLSEGNNSLPYFKATFDTNADQHTIDTSYEYKVNNKVLLKNIKNPSQGLYEWFNYYSLMDAYDTEKESFSLKKLKSSYRYQNMEKMKCRTEELEN